MIVGLRGKILKKEPMFIEIDVCGVIYGVYMSLNGTTKLANTFDLERDSQVRIVCAEIIREDAHLLFGFCDDVEKQTFERLLKINGVGPKVALAILSTYTPQAFGQIVANKDVQALQKVPGIGAKSAGKIMVDIAGFFEELIQTQRNDITESSKYQATLALQSLGFKSSDIKKALQGIDDLDVSNIVKIALSKLATPQ